MRLIIIPIAVALMMTGCQNRRQAIFTDVITETYIHKYGVEVPPNDWNQRGKDGQIVMAKKDGVTVTQTYDSGILHGPTSSTFPHSSSVEKVETYVQGNITKEVKHYRSGPPMQETQFKTEGEKHITTWYENGTPKSVEEHDDEGLLVKGEYYNTSHQIEAQVDNKNGIRIIRNQYGLVVSKDTIQDGVMSVRTTFHYNGNPKEIAPYKNGIVDGMRRTFLPDGEPNTQEQWENGRPNGTTIVFQNGEKAAEIPYVNGKKNGIEHHFRDGHIIVEEIAWQNDLQDGPKTTYVGEIASTEWYFEGQPVSKANFDLRSHAAKRPYTQHFPD